MGAQTLSCKARISDGGPVTISLAELKAILDKRRTPPKELGELWTIDQIASTSGQCRTTLDGKLRRLGVRNWSPSGLRGDRRMWCAADVMKFAKEGKL
jgi:hypothetical protein